MYSHNGYCHYRNNFGGRAAYYLCKTGVRKAISIYAHIYIQKHIHRKRERDIDFR
jgi:hypothetical protein